MVHGESRADGIQEISTAFRMWVMHVYVLASEIDDGGLVHASLYWRHFVRTSRQLGNY
jgi:hypothetical protein